MTDLDELRAKVRAASAAVAEASARLPQVENPAREAASILLEVNGDAGDPRLSEAYAHLATARVGTAQAFNSLQAAWSVLNQVAPL